MGTDCGHREIIFRAGQWGRGSSIGARAGSVVLLFVIIASRRLVFDGIVVFVVSSVSILGPF